MLFYINDIRAKDGRTFNEVYNIIKCKYTHNLLLKARTFKFQKLGVKRADSRIPILSKMLSYRISECLNQHRN